MRFSTCFFIVPLLFSYHYHSFFVKESGSGFSLGLVERYRVLEEFQVCYLFGGWQLARSGIGKTIASKPNPACHLFL